jgi:hypothetical protein
MLLPANEKTILVSVTGQSTKYKYEGHFSFKCKLTMQEKYRLEMEKSRMIADIKEPTEGLENIISIIVALKTKIIKSPQWWAESDNGMNLIDDNVILEIYEKCVQAEFEWEKEVTELSEVKSENPTQVQS